MLYTVPAHCGRWVRCWICEAAETRLRARPGVAWLAHMKGADHLIARLLHIGGQRRGVLAVDEVLGGAVEREHEYATLVELRTGATGDVELDGRQATHRDLLRGPAGGGPKVLDEPRH